MAINIEKSEFLSSRIISYLHLARRDTRTSVLLPIKEVYETSLSLVLVVKPIENVLVLQKMIDDGSGMAPLPAIRLFKDILNHFELLKRRRVFLQELTCENIFLTLNEPIEIYFLLFKHTEIESKDNIPMVHAILKQL